jgi:hypothetical protein
VRKILCLGVLAILTGSASARADSAATVIEGFGLIGTWASYCTVGADRSKPGLRIVFAAPSSDSPTYTTVSSDGAVTTTVRSMVLEAAPVGPGQVRLRLRIVGGDRDGGPLPSPATDTFEQVIEKVEGSGIRLVGADPRFIQKCPE